MNRFTAKELRQLIRAGQWRKSTSGAAPGYVQANLVVLPLTLAYDFLLFCQRNPKPCPVLEVTEPGDPILRRIAPGADLRTDLPKYRIFENGEFIREVNDLLELWRDDLVAFLLGCSYTFDEILIRSGVPLRHYEKMEDTGIYISNIACERAGKFSGPLVVTMRPIPPPLLVRTIQITSRLAKAHGAPVHIGSPQEIGIRDLKAVDFGQVPEWGEGEIPVFWACGVTPQVVALKSRVPFMITHYPGQMLVTDLRLEQIEAE